jgi:hypothetical protein
VLGWPYKIETRGLFLKDTPWLSIHLRVARGRPRGMLNDARREPIRAVSQLATLPGLCIVVTVLAFDLVGDGLHDALDPGLKR